jgi:hypothetical protein
VLKRFFLLFYMMRVPLLTLLVLGAVLPLAFRTTMLHGIADIATKQIAIVSLTAFLLLCTSITCMFLVLLYGVERAEGLRTGPIPKAREVSSWIVVLLYAGGSLCYLVFLEEVHRFMESANPGVANLTRDFVFQAAAGFAVGGVFMLVLFAIVLRLAKPGEERSLEVFAIPAFFILEKIGWIRQRIQTVKNRQVTQNNLETNSAPHRGFWSLLYVRIVGPGYGSFDETANPVEIYPGHRFAGLLMILSFGIYWWAGRGVYNQLLRPDPFGHARIYDCVLTYLLLLLILLCWLLNGLTFFFDRFRFPVLVTLVLLLYTFSLVGSSDHTYDTVKRGADAGVSLPTPKETLDHAPRQVILVAAAGGGIQSAAWTSQVLCGLRQQLGSEFDNSVVAISGVSGGSVGAMFYLRCLEAGNADMSPAEWARKSSLEAVAWGLTHPDLRRAVLPLPWAWWSHADRGWALEKALFNNAQFQRQNQLMASPGTHGAWPVLLLNSTESGTGDPMVFTNANFPTQGEGAVANHALRSFHLRYPGRDVNLETAVRMSAAFPYVSPVARADQPPGAEHLADGGYFDSSGVFSLGEWLKEAATPEQADEIRAPRYWKKKRFLILEIDAFPDWGTGTANSPVEKWFYQLWAPLGTILKVRSEGAVIRDDTEGKELIEVLASRGYETTQITVRYQPATASEELGTKAGAPCPENPPLSWHLTLLEQRCIGAGWSAMSGPLTQQVKHFLEPEIELSLALPKIEQHPVLRMEDQVRKPSLGLYVRKATPR